MADAIFLFDKNKNEALRDMFCIPGYQTFQKKNMLSIPDEKKSIEKGYIPTALFSLSVNMASSLRSIPIKPDTYSLTPALTDPNYISH